MAGRPDTLSKIAAPAGAVGALAVAIGVWLIPGTALDPKPKAVPAHTSTPGPAVPVIAPPPVPDHDWSALIANLDRLRKADTVIVENAPGDPPPEPPRPGPTSLPWVYEGYVAEPDRLIALVRISGVQRFLFPGQEIHDTSIPGNGTATIKSVEPDRIIVTVGDTDFTIQREVKPQSNALFTAEQQRAGRADE